MAEPLNPYAEEQKKREEMEDELDKLRKEEDEAQAKKQDAQEAEHEAEEAKHEAKEAEEDAEDEEEKVEKAEQKAAASDKKEKSDDNKKGAGLAVLGLGWKGAKWLWNGGTNVVYRNVSLIGIVAFLLMILAGINLATGFGLYSFRIYSAGMVMILLMFIGVPPLKSFVFALGDFVLPSLFINTFVQKIPPMGFGFLSGIANAIPTFSGVPEKVLVLLFVAFTPSLVMVFAIIPKHMDHSAEKGTYNFARGFYTIFIAILFLIFLFAGGGALGSNSAQTIAEMATLTPQGKVMIEDSWDFLLNLPEFVTGGVKGFEKTLLNTGTAGLYYQGEIEKSNKEPVGVYITSFEQSQPRLYDDRQIVILSKMDVMKYPDQEQIMIKTKCSADKGKANQTNVSGETIPSSFVIASQGRKEVQCRFEDGLPAGNRNIEFTSSFEFPTEAGLRVDFMSYEKLKEYNDKGEDPYTAAGLQKPSRSSESSKGPVRVSIEANGPIGLTRGTNQEIPAVGISIKPEWNGKISKLKTFTIYVPEGVALEDCDSDFSSTRSTTKDGYTAYSLSTSDLTRINKDIANYPYHSFTCFMYPTNINALMTDSNGNEVLIAQEFIFARAEYDFDLVASKTFPVVSFSTSNNNAVS